MTAHRAGIYGRQSKDKTKSIAEQFGECEQDVTDIGAVVAARYSDGVSASRFSKKSRDDWHRVLADIDSKRVDMLVLWESSRGDRTPETWLALLSKCRERGVLVRVTSHERTYDPRIPRDWKQLAEDGIDSAYESEKTSLRLRRSMAAQAAAGRPQGHNVYGYLRIYDRETRELVKVVEHPEQAPIVREIVKRIGRGEPVIAVVKDLDQREIPPPKGARWYTSTVREMALRRDYLGVRRLGGEEYPAMWPPIVDLAHHLAARRVLSDPARWMTRPSRQRWLLSYLGVCGVCGAGLHGRPAAGRVLARYGCVRNGCASIQAAPLDEFVSEVVCRRLARPDGPDLRHGDDAEALAAQAEVEQLQARLDDFRDSATRGETSPASLARIEAGLLPQIDAARKRAIAATVPAVLVDLLDGGRRYEEIRRRFDAKPVAARREVIALTAEIRISPRAENGNRNGFDALRLARSRWVGDDRTWGEIWAAGDSFTP